MQVSKGNITSNDFGYRTNEQFPIEFMVQFEEYFSGKYPQVKVTVDGVQAGDIIDDNSYSNDGYRYHDVFHYTFATLLEWSPCTRAMLRRKRKSNVDLDRIEDGARAAITEEAISLMVFINAEKNNFYCNYNKIDDTILTMIKNMTEPFEVKEKSKEDWEKAILKGYEIFRYLMMNKSGCVRFNTSTKNIVYQKIF